MIFYTGKGDDILYWVCVCDHISYRVCVYDDISYRKGVVIFHTGRRAVIFHTGREW